MKTPIIDFVSDYEHRRFLRLHMPGHKGVGPLGTEGKDITEIDGADMLYKPGGIIKKSQANTASLFGTYKTVYSAEGSSLAIRAMLYLTAVYAAANGLPPVIYAGRNAHKTFITAAGLLDLTVEWLYPENSGSLVSCDITAKSLDDTLSCAPQKPTAVYITSPDYLGNMLNVAEISKVCKKHGVLLLVDNAHGAYLNFLENNLHPIKNGADICCDSAHKTLPVLTGGAYLHISVSAPQIFKTRAESAMALFASTSPSYLILQSLDGANKYLANNYPEKLKSFILKLDELKAELASHGYVLCGNEPLKLTVYAKAYGYTGDALAEKLAENGIICEYHDPDHAVFMFTPEIDDKDLAKFKNQLLAIERQAPINTRPPAVCRGKKRYSLHRALFLPSKSVLAEQSVGLVAADPAVNRPPAVPIVICGEEITENAAECFKYYGINICRVIDIQTDHR